MYSRLLLPAKEVPRERNLLVERLANVFCGSSSCAAAQLADQSSIPRKTSRKSNAVRSPRNLKKRRLEAGARARTSGTRSKKATNTPKGVAGRTPELLPNPFNYPGCQNNSIGKPKIFPKPSLSYSVEDYVRRDVLEKGLEVLDHLDDVALNRLVAQVMDIINKLHGDTIQKELENYIGVEKYREIAAQEETTRLATNLNFLIPSPNNERTKGETASALQSLPKGFIVLRGPSNVLFLTNNMASQEASTSKTVPADPTRLEPQVRRQPGNETSSSSYTDSGFVGILSTRCSVFPKGCKFVPLKLRPDHASNISKPASDIKGSHFPPGDSLLCKYTKQSFRPIIPASTSEDRHSPLILKSDGSAGVNSRTHIPEPCFIKINLNPPATDQIKSQNKDIEFNLPNEFNVFSIPKHHASATIAHKPVRSSNEEIEVSSCNLSGTFDAVSVDKRTPAQSTTTSQAANLVNYPNEEIEANRKNISPKKYGRSANKLRKYSSKEIEVQNKFNVVSVGQYTAAQSTTSFSIKRSRMEANVSTTGGCSLSISNRLPEQSSATITYKSNEISATKLTKCSREKISVDCSAGSSLQNTTNVVSIDKLAPAQYTTTISLKGLSMTANLIKDPSEDMKANISTTCGSLPNPLPAHSSATISHKPHEGSAIKRVTSSSGKTKVDDSACGFLQNACDVVLVGKQAPAQPTSTNSLKGPSMAVNVFKYPSENMKANISTTGDSLRNEFDVVSISGYLPAQSSATTSHKLIEPGKSSNQEIEVDDSACLSLQNTCNVQSHDAQSTTMSPNGSSGAANVIKNSNEEMEVNLPNELKINPNFKNISPRSPIAIKPHGQSTDEEIEVSNSARGGARSSLKINPGVQLATNFEEEPEVNNFTASNSNSKTVLLKKCLPLRPTNSVFVADLQPKIENDPKPSGIVKNGDDNVMDPIMLDGDLREVLSLINSERKILDVRDISSSLGAGTKYWLHLPNESCDDDVETLSESTKTSRSCNGCDAVAVKVEVVGNESTLSIGTRDKTADVKTLTQLSVVESEVFSDNTMNGSESSKKVTGGEHQVRKDFVRDGEEFLSHKTDESRSDGGNSVPLSIGDEGEATEMYGSGDGPSKQRSAELTRGGGEFLTNETHKNKNNDISLSVGDEGESSKQCSKGLTRRDEVLRYPNRCAEDFFQDVEIIDVDRKVLEYLGKLPPRPEKKRGNPAFLRRNLLRRTVRDMSVKLYWRICDLRRTYRRLGAVVKMISFNRNDPNVNLNLKVMNLLTLGRVVEETAVSFKRENLRRLWSSFRRVLLTRKERLIIRNPMFGRRFVQTRNWNVEDSENGEPPNGTKDNVDPTGSGGRKRKRKSLPGDPERLSTLRSSDHLR